MDDVPYVFERSVTSRDAIDKINEACYDNRASLWDRFPFPNVLPGYITKYYQSRLGNRVLDVGSGTGVLAKWLADQDFELLCLDPSTEMVRRCREKGLTTLQTTIQSYHPNEQFAMIFAILSLIHVPKAEFATQLKKLADALPEGGLLFLGMLEGQGEGFFEPGDYPRFFAYYSPEEIEKATQKDFKRVDYHVVRTGTIGYMLFVLQKGAK